MKTALKKAIKSSSGKRKRAGAVSILLSSESDAKTKHARIKFGAVTVDSRTPRKSEIRRNVVVGQLALKRAKSRIIKPGVTIHAGANIPLYHADPEKPGKLIRILNGKQDRGVFVNGRFIVK
jgi:hypothetical protein